MIHCRDEFFSYFHFTFKLIAPIIRNGVLWAFLMNQISKSKSDYFKKRIRQKWWKKALSCEKQDKECKK